MDNLNKLSTCTDDGVIPLSNYNAESSNVTFEKFDLYFRDLEKVLIQKIHEHANGFIFGSVAWLTSENIINALAKCKNVQILIQKEDFLRPDLGDDLQEKARRYKYRKLYSKLKFSHDRYDCNSPICHLSVCGNPTIDAVR